MMTSDRINVYSGFILCLVLAKQFCSIPCIESLEGVCRVIALTVLQVSSSWSLMYSILRFKVKAGPKVGT